MLSRAVFVLTSLVAAPITASAQTAPEPTPDPAPTFIDVQPGPVTLPLAGLEVRLPRHRAKDAIWRLSSSFSLEGGYDARDVIDERAGDALIAGTWVNVGYFSAGGCAAVLNEIPMEWGRDGEGELFGMPWSTRIGMFDFQNDLGKVPAVVLCGEREGRKTILIHHFFLDTAHPMPVEQGRMIAAMRKNALVRDLATSWRTERTVDSPALAARQVRNRGSVAPNREESIPTLGRSIRLPDDGFIWHVLPATSEGEADQFSRVAPSLPEIHVEVVPIPDTTCATFFQNLDAPTLSTAAPIHVPAGWTAGPTLDVEGIAEYSACHDHAGGVLIAGVFFGAHRGSGVGDFQAVTPLLGALVEATRP